MFGIKCEGVLPTAATKGPGRFGGSLPGKTRETRDKGQFWRAEGPSEVILVWGSITGRVVGVLGLGAAIAGKRGSAACQNEPIFLSKERAGGGQICHVHGACDGFHVRM